jgi:hypothetical protein
MLDKIVMNQDRTEATIHFDTHSFHLYHSGGNVMELIDIVLNNRVLELVDDSDTEIMEIQLCLDLEAA